MDAHFEKSMERWKQTETPSLAAHLDSAFTMMARLFPHPPPDSYYVLDLAVDPARQKGGIGRQLMNAAIEHGLSLGRTSLQLDVEGENAALHFYKRIGMEIEVETRVPYLANNHGIGLHYHMIMPIDPSG
jgi:ribosomal protein S18 acetylase RimI-like enzyme